MQLPIYIGYDEAICSICDSKVAVTHVDESGVCTACTRDIDAITIAYILNNKEEDYVPFA